jgi:chromosome segregation ATPase
MKRLVIGFSVMSLLGLASMASAQSLFERCEKKKQKITDMEADVGKTEAKITTISERLRDLRRQQRELNVKKSDLLRRIKSEKAHHNRMCSALRQCERYEQKVDKLRDRIDPLAQRLRKIREEIRERQGESNRLSEEAEKIENAYQNLNCDNLVAGDVAQSTIDRCNALFSSWNKIAKDIKALDSSVISLRDRYQRVMKRMQSIRAELAQLTRQMNQACSHSTYITKLESMEKEQHTYRAMKDDLDRMNKRMRRFKTMKLRQPKRKMKIKPKKKKGKPVIKPKKK